MEIGDTFTQLNDRSFTALNGIRESFGCGNGGGDAVVDVTSSFAPVIENWIILSAPTKEWQMEKEHEARIQNTFLRPEK